MMYASKHKCIFKVGCKFIPAETFTRGSLWDERSLVAKGEEDRGKGNRLP